MFHISRRILWERSIAKWKMFLFNTFHSLGLHQTKFYMITLNALDPHHNKTDHNIDLQKMIL